MAEAESSGGGSNFDGWFILFVLVVFLVLWLRGGGLHRFLQHPLNFGWKSVASSTSSFPFAPNYEQFAPHVAGPAAPQGPGGAKTSW